MTKTLILDIDETLLHSVYGNQPEGFVPVMDEDGNLGYFSKPRNGVYDFLKEIQTKGWDIICLTLGVVPFQEQVLKTLGMRKYVGSIYGWASIDRRAVIYPPRNLEKFVLLDNCHIRDWQRVGQKAGWLDRPLQEETNYVTVEDFYSDDVKPLLDYLPRIEELMDA